MGGGGEEAGAANARRRLDAAPSYTKPIDEGRELAAALS